MTEDGIKSVLRNTYKSCRDFLFVSDGQGVNLVYKNADLGYGVRFDFECLDYDSSVDDKDEIGKAHKILAEACRITEKNILEHDGVFMACTTYVTADYRISVAIKPEDKKEKK